MDKGSWQPLDFVWDEAKAAANQRKHGVRFDWAADVFVDWYRVDFDVTRPEEGESRRKVVGAIEGFIVAVVYTPRDEAIRIISARRANTTEVKRYARQVHA